MTISENVSETATGGVSEGISAAAVSTGCQVLLEYILHIVMTVIDQVCLVGMSVIALWLKIV